MYAHLVKFGTDSNMYHLPFAWHITGPFDVAKFVDVLRHILAEHEAFRTVLFKDAAGVVHQRVMPADFYADSTWYTAHQRPGMDPDAALAELEMQLLAPFDYTGGPMYRAVTYDLGGSKIISMCLHHLSVDGGSLILIMKQLTDMYLSKEPFQLRKLLQPIDFAQYEAARLRDDAATAAIDFWTPMAELSIAHPMVLPHTSRRPGNPNGVYGKRGIVAIEHKAATLNAIQRFVNEYNTSHRRMITPFVVFFATLHMALGFFCSNDIVSLGSLFVNREGEWWQTLGPLFNTIVYAFDLGAASADTFTDYIEHVGEQVEASRPHTWLPQSALVGALRRRRKKIPKDGLYSVS